MQMTSLIEFGLQAIMRLASEPETSRPAADIANEFGISRDHLAKGMAPLSRAGLIVTRRGGREDAILAKPANKISSGAIFRALHSEQPLIECFRQDGGRWTLPGRSLLRFPRAAASPAFVATQEESYRAEAAGLRPGVRP
ncbi:Rrf2 family transcriptional regulator [Paracoccus tegillarcae]|uniref:Rrf2 family transcriptional regulator n=2 Tax=Paracoccus tegillarcae TaxID=1529068 RepID=A0A2K9ETX9_9RHOB|nr:Rrf2 family transcriptional regulator [Paracoccus tegillarcae]